MLEDPSYEHIVRWGEGGESFVVLEVWEENYEPPPVASSDIDSIGRTRNSPS